MVQPRFSLPLLCKAPKCGKGSVNSYKLANTVLIHHFYRPDCHHFSSVLSLSSSECAALVAARFGCTLSHPKILSSRWRGWCSIQLAGVVSTLPLLSRLLPSAHDYPALARLA